MMRRFWRRAHRHGVPVPASCSVLPVPLRLDPDPGPALTRALASLLEREGLLGETTPAHGGAWRSEAFREGVAREPGRPRESEADRGYVAAPSPRRTRGATRA
jgi:hypothetical protein